MKLAVNGDFAEGLVELIVLNVGLGAGVINTEVFTIMVMMALVTTFMTWVGRTSFRADLLQKH